MIQSITEWEEIPGIDKVIEHAKRNSVGVFLLNRRQTEQVYK